jgi:hypothetical protein
VWPGPLKRHREPEPDPALDAKKSKIMAFARAVNASSTNKALLQTLSNRSPVCAPHRTSVLCYPGFTRLCRFPLLEMYQLVEIREMLFAEKRRLSCLLICCYLRNNIQLTGAVPLQLRAVSNALLGQLHAERIARSNAKKGNNSGEGAVSASTAAVPEAKQAISAKVEPFSVLTWNVWYVH